MSNTSVDTYCFRISGPDATKFLQGQLPVDLTSNRQDACLLSVACKPNGKVFAIYALHQSTEDDQDVYSFIVLGAQAQALHSHLKKFSVFSKVTFSDLEQVKLDPNQTALNPTCFWASATLAQAQQGMAQYAALLAVPTSEQSQSTTGQAVVFYLKPELAEQFLPQALGFGFDDEAISFKKGCYQGQEGVARAKYRGTNPQVWRTFTASQPVPALTPTSEAKLAVKLGDNWKTTGTLLYQAGGYYQVVLSKKLDPLAEGAEAPVDYQYQLTLEAQSYPLELVLPAAKA